MPNPAPDIGAVPTFAGPYVLVPIYVQALPVDSNGNGQTWPDLTPHFDRIFTNFQVLGEQISPGQEFVKSGAQLPAGIHLHWALPDGLTHAQSPRARATATVAGGAVTAVNVIDPGSGYSAAPKVSFAGPGSGATAVVDMSFEVTKVVVVSGGSGYLAGATGTTASFTVPLNGAGGTGAIGQAIVSTRSGTVIGLNVLTPGSGYTDSFTIPLSGGGGTGAVVSVQVGNGRVADIRILPGSGGSGYLISPQVTIASGGVPQYPMVPNRWVVIRVATNYAAYRAGNPQWTKPINVDAWVLASDLLSPTQDEIHQVVQPWPAGEGQWLNSAQYIGGWTAYTGWKEAAAAKDLFLTAIGPGDPAFAAFYPNCQQVLGFHDNIQDPLKTEFLAGTVTLTYAVIGWYSNPQFDPLAGYTSAADWVRRMAGLQWSVNPPYPIADVVTDKSTGKTTITISGFGDLSNTFPVNSIFQIAGSTYNDGTYEVESITPPTTGTGPSTFKIMVAGLLTEVADGAILPASTVLPTQTLCHGAVYQVSGTAPNGVPTATPSVAVGNTAVEALAALVAKNLATTNPPYQNVARVLEAFQYQLLNDLDQPSGAVEVEEALHSQSFDRMDGGKAWLVRPPVLASSQPLGGNVGLLLNDLNLAQQKVDGLVRKLASLQRETYYAWYKRTLVQFSSLSSGEPGAELLAAQTPDPNGLEQVISALAGAISQTQQSELIPAYQALNAAKSQVAAALPAGYQLQETAMPPFWRPSDPSVLLAGDGVGRSFAHGEDGRFTPDGTLVCRVSGKTITGLNVTPPGLSQAGQLTLVDLASYGGTLPEQGSSPPAVPADVVTLFGETLLLDPTPSQDEVLALVAFVKAGVQAPVADAVTSLATSIQRYQTAWQNANLHKELRVRVERADQQLASAAGLVGTVPSGVGFVAWKWPWTPLFFCWEAFWYPSYAGSDMGNPGKPDWGLGNNWKLDPASANPLSEVDFVWPGPPPTLNLAAGISLTGVVAITPQAIDNFADRLNQYLTTLPATDPDYQELSDSAKAISALNVVSQSLSGLGSRLMMQLQSLQLPVISLGPVDDVFANDNAIADAVKAVIDDQTGTAPIYVDSRYFPIRAGHLTISRLWLVDGFGQVSRIADSGKAVFPVLAEGVQTTGDTSGSVIQLAPRITQPARLLFQLMAAGDATDTVQANSAPSTTPVCAWLLPNHLNQSLMVYDNTGQPLGELALVDHALGSLRWTGVPGCPPALGAPLPADWNRHLLGFLQGLINRGLTQEDSALADFLEVIDSTLMTIDPLGSRKDQSLSVLIGRPLALIRASLRLDLAGLPVFDEGLQATAKLTGRVQGASQPLDFDDDGFFDDHGFRQVPFPVRLGDVRNLQDGLIGYFVDDDYSTFYSVLPGATTATGSAYISQKNEVNLTAAMWVGNTPDPFAGSKPPQFHWLTLVVDPRAAVHATSGILPVQSVEVPPDLIADALAAIDVTFFTGPVLSDSEQLQIPLPAFQAGTWSWIDHPGVTVWQPNGTIGKVSTQATVTNRPQKVYEGWLKLSGALGPQPAARSNEIRNEPLSGRTP